MKRSFQPIDLAGNRKDGFRLTDQRTELTHSFEMLEMSAVSLHYKLRALTFTYVSAIVLSIIPALRKILHFKGRIHTSKAGGGVMHLAVRRLSPTYYC